MLEHTVGKMIERCARFYGPDDAVVQGDRRITYAELISEVRRAGRAFLRLGLKRGDRVAILMNDRPELLSCMYGAQWAGLAIVPLNARLGAEDHTYILQNSGARVLCHDATFADRVSSIRDEAGVEFLVALDSEAVLDGGLDFDTLLAAEDDGPGMPDVGPDDLVSIFYTGGTTGRPKGVAHSHRTLLPAFLSETLEMGLGDRDVFAHVAPMTHAGGAFALPIWMRGGTNLILGGFDPDQLLHAIANEGVTSTLMVPTMLYVMLDHPGLDGTDTSSLSTVAYGAAPMGRERLLQALDRFGPIFSQLYGQTEAPNQLCVLRKQDHADAIASGNHDILSSCGRPVTIADVRIADDDLNDVPPGESGEIVARGPHVMLRYWDNPKATAETIRDGWLCTGDIAKTDERGYVYIVDRKKDMIISGGFNVYPKEVEQALFAHPAVRDACVIGIPDDKWGESVKAVVVTDGSGEVAEADLIAWVRERKGSVLAPKSVDFVDEIPLTAVGKHDKPALREAYWAGRERAVS